MRQTGRTTRAMTNALQGAVYVWPNSQFDYPRRLLEKLDRPDIELVSAVSLIPEKFLGQRPRTPIIVDHAARLTREQHQLVNYHNQIYCA